MKKLLILGAMEMHVPLIKRAKELGIYTITCDYIPENPGHKIADEAHFDSTTDPAAVLRLAKASAIDGIMTYNSDPAAKTVAYVAEKLGLPGNSYESVKTMSEKDLFRDFLKKKGLNVPEFGKFNTKEEAKRNISKFHFPIIIKPVDASGSKGCTVLKNTEDLGFAIDCALEKSRCKRFIVEEYIESVGPQLHGDGFVKNGHIEFLCLGDHHFDSSINNIVPYSTTFPTSHSAKEIEACREQIQSFISKVKFSNGGFNVELRISKQNGKPYIIDIGARNGGNFTPKVIEYATGFNFMDAAISVALGKEPPAYKLQNNGFFSYLVLYAKKEGFLKSIEFSKEIESRLLEKHLYLKSGDHIEKFFGANSAIGVLLLKYESREIMDSIVNGSTNQYKIKMD
ncbi:MAG: ATP-grasp domain-containing protein [Fibrobacteraceae bacterium]|nr:ATP-grasp domain-containing protein [Fibrobacteraceae bacterium]